MITKLDNDSKFTHRWIEDVKRIQEVLVKNDYSASLKDCADVWTEYSESLCAGWLNLPEDDGDILGIVESIL